MADIETLAANTRYFVDGSSAPSTPSAGQAVTYSSNSKLYFKNSAGTETDLTGGLVNPMTTAEDIIVGGASGTPARLAVGTEGQVLSVSSGAVAWAAASGGITEHAYITGTSTVTVASTTAGSPTSVITTTSIDVGSGAIDIEFWCYAYRLANGDQINVSLWEDSTEKGLLAILLNYSGGNYQRSALNAKYRYTPGSGSKTFSVRAYMVTGTNGLLGAGAGGTGTGLPMFLRITSAP